MTPASRPRVLIGFAESLAAIESAWCLTDAGFEVVAYTRAGRRPALAASRRVRIEPVPAPETDLEASVAGLRALIAREQPVAVLPLDDQSVLLTDRLGGGPPIPGPTDVRIAGPTGVRIAGPTGALARLALDKREQLALAEKAGFAVPPTIVIGKAAKDPPQPEGPGPWIVKCALATVEDAGRLRRPGGGIARQPSDVPRLAAEVNAPTLVQPVIDGVGEGLFGTAVNGEVFALSAHRRVRMMNPRGSGSSACRSIPVDPELAGLARRFIDEAAWNGIFMLEFLRDDAGRAWFMELNGRTWGSMALARHRALPYPVWAVESALDPSWLPSVPPEAPHLRCRHLGRELVHLLAVLRGARGGDVGRWPSRGATLRAMLRPERGTRWYHARLGELPVLFRDTWNTVADQVFRRRG